MSPTTANSRESARPWTSLPRRTPSLAEVVDLKFFCGFSFAEIAAMRGVSERTVQRKWEKARIYLHRSIRAAFVVCEEPMSTLNPDQWQALSPYLDQALAMPEEERAAWLASLRAQDPALAAHLQALLEEHRALAQEHFLEQGPAPPLRCSRGSRVRPSAPTRWCRSLARAEWAAFGWPSAATDSFERQAAVKFVSLRLAGRGGEERFKREGSILGRLAAPSHRRTSRRRRLR